MKIFKNLFLFVLLSLFVVLQGFCGDTNEWIESQYTHENQTFVLSFPGIPVETTGYAGSRKRLDLDYSGSGFCGGVISFPAKQERALNFMQKKFEGNINRDQTEAKLFKEANMVVLEVIWRNEEAKRIVFVEPNIYFFYSNGSLEDMRHFFDSFRILEIRD